MATETATLGVGSLPAVGYWFTVTGVTADGTTVNTVSVPGIPPDFVASGCLLFCETATASAGGAYASINRTTFDAKKNPSSRTDPTIMPIDIYCYDEKDHSGASSGLTIKGFLY